MKIQNRLLSKVLAAAACGIVAGAVMGCDSSAKKSGDASKAAAEKSACNGKNGCKSEASSCKGKNACKGQGGCKTDAHGCKGQNACKGQGGCKSLNIAARC